MLMNIHFFKFILTSFPFFCVSLFCFVVFVLFLSVCCISNLSDSSLTEAPDKSNTIQALENTSHVASVKVLKTKNKSELLDDNLKFSLKTNF